MEAAAGAVGVVHAGAVERSGSLGWVRAHEELSRLARCRAALDWEEGRGLLAALRAGAHRHLGFGSFVEYVEALFGYKARSVEEKLRVAEALEGLPLLAGELRAGRLSWSAVRELSRVATGNTERAWREFARGRSVRQIEDWVSGRKLGDEPDARADPALRRFVLAFEVRAETRATFREALAKLRRDAGEALDEESALLLMARQVLGGPSDPGRASYQVAFTRCEECGRGFQQGRGEQVEVDAQVARMVECDAQYVGRVGGSAHVGAPAKADNDADSIVGAERILSDAKPRQRAPLARATQAVPPAVRRFVLRRDGGRCVVPGCSHAVFVDVHHLELRSEGGGHNPDSLVVVCSAHHRALHRGQLIAEGSTARELVFRHADGSRYRSGVSVLTVEAQTKAFGALRNLGFREGEVNRVLGELRAHEIGGGAEGLVRAALGLLTRRQVE